MTEYRGYNRERRIPVPELEVPVTRDEAVCRIGTLEIEAMKETCAVMNCFYARHETVPTAYEMSEARELYYGLPYEERNKFYVRPTKEWAAIARERMAEATDAEIAATRDHMDSMRNELLKLWDARDKTSRTLGKLRAEGASIPTEAWDYDDLEKALQHVYTSEDD